MLKVGELIGTYRILGVLEDGWTGRVWLGEHLALGRRAAIEELTPWFSRDPDAVLRLFKEARAASLLSEDIVAILEVGFHADGTTYLVMEALEGESLGERIHRLQRLPVVEAVRFVHQAARALGIAHQHRILHRALTPEDVFLLSDPQRSGEGRAKLRGFGVANLFSESGAATTAWSGDPAYKAPEQVRGRPPDARSDVYSLGCVLFEALTGEPPFRESDGKVSHLLEQIVHEPPPIPSSLAPEISPPLDALVLRCLSKDPDRRSPSGAELAEQLEGLLRTAL